jgi:hypothetical protein
LDERSLKQGGHLGNPDWGLVSDKNLGKFLALMVVKRYPPVIFHRESDGSGIDGYRPEKAGGN